MILFNCCSIRVSVIFFPSIKLKIEFFRCAVKYLCISEIIFNCFSLSILFRVSVSLQYTLGIIGVPRYSPIRASICFLIRGVNSKDVGFPMPKFSSKYLNYSSSRIPL
nr:MAG TPA: hypothetical protein [Bacteriophage sp.]